ncbi:unnamed protein product [Ectocarpus sp. 8 AP-2014]
MVREDDFAWQVIVVQTRRDHTGITKQQELPLQITITYGDEKVSTPLVRARQPLWNFWTQLPDKGGAEGMVFSLVGRDSSTGKISVEGEARLDLSKFRRSGQSFELWEALHPTKARGVLPMVVKSARPADATAEVHLTITYCPNTQKKDIPDGEDTDCLMCATFATFGLSRGSCSIS